MVTGALYSSIGPRRALIPFFFISKDLIKALNLGSWLVANEGVSVGLT